MNHEVDAINMFVHTYLVPIRGTDDFPSLSVASFACTSSTLLIPTAVSQQTEHLQKLEHVTVNCELKWSNSA